MYPVCSMSCHTDSNDEDFYHAFMNSNEVDSGSDCWNDSDSEYSDFETSSTIRDRNAKQHYEQYQTILAILNGKDNDEDIQSDGESGSDRVVDSPEIDDSSEENSLVSGYEGNDRYASGYELAGVSVYSDSTGSDSSTNEQDWYSDNDWTDVSTSFNGDSDNEDGSVTYGARYIHDSHFSDDDYQSPEEPAISFTASASFTPVYNLTQASLGTNF